MRLELGRVAVRGGERDLVFRIGERRRGGYRYARCLQLLRERERPGSLLVEDGPAAPVVVDVGRPRLAHRHGPHSGLLGGLEEGTGEEEMSAQIPSEVVENGIVLGENGLPEIDLLAGGVLALRLGLPEHVAVEADPSRERSGREARGVHHRKRRVGRVIVGELDAGFAQRVEVGGVGRIDRIRTQPVPDENDDFAFLRKGGSLRRAEKQCGSSDAAQESGEAGGKNSARFGHVFPPVASCMAPFCDTSMYSRHRAIDFGRLVELRVDALHRREVEHQVEPARHPQVDRHERRSHQLDRRHVTL